MSNRQRSINRRSPSHSLTLVRRIPRALKQRLVGFTVIIPYADTAASVSIKEKTQAIRFRIRGANIKEARDRQRSANLFLDLYFERMLSERLVAISHKQTLALAGEVYSAWAGEPDILPHKLMFIDGIDLPTKVPTDFEAEATRLSALAEAVQHYQLPENEDECLRTFGPMVDAMLTEKGVPLIEKGSRGRIAREIAKALPQALRTRARYASGDYRPDDLILRFPEWEPPAISGKDRSAARTKMRRTGVSLSKLVDDWWDEHKGLGKVESTYLSYQRTTRMLADFMGHDDALQITPEDLQGYKQFRLQEVSAKKGKPITARSFKAGDMATIKSLFKWAVESRYLTANPAADMVVRVGKRIKLRDRDFTPEEAIALLKAATEWKRKKPNDPDRYWVPWLCAYTGCRVGEAAQLRKMDVREASEGVWTITITPEAGVVKGKETREVPLHDHLIELGFVQFVAQSKGEYLFLDDKRAEKNIRRAITTRITRLRALAREVVPDVNVAPNHGWRHTFKSRGFEVGVQEKVLDAICGHTAQTVARQYGSVTLKTKVEAMKLFPRFNIECQETRGAAVSKSAIT